MICGRNRNAGDGLDSISLALEHRNIGDSNAPRSTNGVAWHAAFIAQPSQQSDGKAEHPCGLRQGQRFDDDDYFGFFVLGARFGFGVERTASTTGGGTGTRNRPMRM